MLGRGDVAGLEILAELAEECGDRILLAGGLAGLAATMVAMMVAVRGARLLASLLQILLDSGEIGLRGREVADFKSCASCETAVPSGLLLCVPDVGDSRELWCPLGRSC